MPIVKEGSVHALLPEGKRAPQSSPATERRKIPDCNIGLNGKDPVHLAHDSNKYRNFVA
jgi:hypothetical protein